MVVIGILGNIIILKTLVTHFITLFFLLDQKETKNQSASWRKLQCNTAEKIASTLAGSSLKKYAVLFINALPRTVSPYQPHHYQCM